MMDHTPQSLGDVLSGLSTVFGVVAGPAAVAGAFALYWQWGRNAMRHRFIPLVIAAVLLALFVCDIGVKAGWIGYANELELVSNKSFENEAVRVDGRSFYQCSFRNVTLVYNGGATLFYQNAFSGNNKISTTRGEFFNLVTFLKEIGGLSIPVEMTPLSLIPRPQ